MHTHAQTRVYIIGVGSGGGDDSSITAWRYCIHNSGDNK